MFVVKKIIGGFLTPLPLVMVLLILGTFLAKRKKFFLITGLCTLYLFSFTPFIRLLLLPLESPYLPISAANLRHDTRWIVVLGGGTQEDAILSPEDRLSYPSLKRLMEGLRLAGLLPQARLVLSGGDYRGIIPDAMAMYQVALDHGFARNRIIVERSSWDTVDQARILKDRLGNEPFYLVTSASHMTRAMSLFRHSGTFPLAAPTDFRGLRHQFTILDFFPHADNLTETERAFHEYLGLCWGFLRGQI